jgi:O-antigen ligase
MIYYVAGFLWGCANWAPLLAETDYYEACIAGSVIIAAALLFSAQSEPDIRLGDIWWAAPLLILGAAVGVGASFITASELDPMQIAHEGFLLFGFFALIKLIRGGGKNVERFVQGMLLVASGSLLVSLFYGNTPHMEGDSVRLGFEAGWNPNSLGYVAGTVAVISLSHLLEYPRKAWTDVYYSSLIVLSVVVTMATQSRTSIGVLLLGLAYLLVRLRGRTKKYLTLCVGLVAMWYFFDDFLVVTRWTTTVGQETHTTPLAGREQTWSDGLQLFWERPVIGYGLSSNNPLVHNAYLQIAVNTGVIGLMCYLPLLAVAVLKSFRSRLSAHWMHAILYMGLFQAVAESHLMNCGIFSGAIFTLCLLQFMAEEVSFSTGSAARMSLCRGAR